jgi:hypothetical protein
METSYQSSRPARKLLEELLESEAWMVYKQALEQQQQAHSQWQRAPLLRLEAVLMQEYDKGVCAGIDLALSLPATLIEVAKQETALQQRQRDDDES